MFRIILVLIALAYTLGCQKNEMKISSDFDCSEKAVTDRDGTPTVQVVDSTLVFESIAHYNQVQAYVQSASVSTLTACE